MAISVLYHAGRALKPALVLCGLWAGASAMAGTTVSATLAPVAASPAASASNTASKVQQFTLRNGMTLIVQADRRAPTAMHMVWLRVGAMDEVDGTSGVAHVLEHMMFKGSAQVPPGDFSRRVAALGGQENAFTSRDYTGYYQQIPSDQLAAVMALESDRFAHNQWPDAEFLKEVEVVKEERRLRTDDKPRALLMEQLYATAFNASPYRRPVIGWMSDIASLTANDVRQFHRQWYTPANAAIVVVGDVDVQQVRKLAENTYGRIAARATPPRKPRTEPTQQGLRRVEVKAPAEQGYVALAFKAPALRQLDAATMQETDRDALALIVLSALLSGYDGARLERALSQGPQRVADATHSGADVLGRGPSLFVLMGVPTQGKTAAEVEAALRAELARVARDGVNSAELERVKTQWTASTIYERDSLQSRAQDLGSSWVQNLPLDSEDKLLALLHTVTPAQVQAVAQRYFVDEQLTVATLVPQPLDPQRKRTPGPTLGMRH